jgi:hypothetical protein
MQRRRCPEKWVGVTHHRQDGQSPTSQHCRTWYVVSKTPYMKDLMIDVFPTPWSPKNTSLYLARGANDGGCAAGAWGVVVGGTTVAMAKLSSNQHTGFALINTQWGMAGSVRTGTSEQSSGRHDFVLTSPQSGNLELV